MPYVSGAVPRKEYGISNPSARRWRNNGTIKTIETAEGYFRDLLEGVVNVHLTTKDAKGQSIRSKIAYCRVSSSQQKYDLKRQEESFWESHPDHEIIKYIGSGINFKRRGFLRIVESIYCKVTSKKLLSHIKIESAGSPNLVVQEQILRSTGQELRLFTQKINLHRRSRNRRSRGHHSRLFV